MFARSPFFRNHFGHRKCRNVMPAQKTFLLVEDDAYDVLFLQTEFGKAPVNLDLHVVSDGVVARRYLEGQGEYADREKHPVPDVILVDLRLSRVDGFEFLEWLRSRSPGRQRLIPVIVPSSLGQPEDVLRAYTLGANSYVVKPVDWQECRERIRALGVYWAAHAETPSLKAES
jgi:DNA-binding response OmpR family regulator